MRVHFVEAVPASPEWRLLTAGCDAPCRPTPVSVKVKYLCDA
jgi:hypothetical protein